MRRPRTNTRRRASRTASIATTVALLVLTACSSTSDEDAETEQRLAEQLVAATEQAGVAPRLTVDVAESLYGTDAANVCDAFSDGLGAAENVMLGNPALGRRKAITDDSVIYTGLVIDTYCPDEADEFDAVVDDLDPMDVSPR